MTRWGDTLAASSAGEAVGRVGPGAAQQACVEKQVAEVGRLRGPGLAV